MGTERSSFSAGGDRAVFAYRLAKSERLALEVKDMKASPPALKRKIGFQLGKED